MAHFRKIRPSGNARTLVNGMLAPGVIEEVLEYPVTTEIAFEDPSYNDALRSFYDDCVRRLMLHVEEGRDVAVALRGRPHSSMDRSSHLHSRITGPRAGRSGARHFRYVRLLDPRAACRSRLAMTSSLSYRRRLRSCFGRTAEIDRRACRHEARPQSAESASRAAIRWHWPDRAIYVERGTMADEKVLPLAEKIDDEAPYFSMILVHGRGRRP